MPAEPAKRRFLTNPNEFQDVSRGDPKPHTLKGEALVKARLTPQSWRLEIVSDASAQLAKPRTLDAGTALDLQALHELGKHHAARFLKAMQCLNIAQPLGQGLWEGVPLREVLRLVGKVDNVRRVYYWGFHNNDPAQMFQSSLGYNQVMETPPWDLGPLVAYRLNGRPISLLRGGPVRMVVPWAHGFKSIKWLQRIVLTNDYKANDTYALANNDPDSYLKTMARIDDGPAEFPAGNPITLHGTAMVGWSGLKRVEYWLRPDAGTHGRLAEDDAAWKTAKWQPCVLFPAPADWGGSLPDDVMPQDVWGFDPKTGKPQEWPMRFSVAPWTVTLKDLKAGTYEFRVRSVDLNGYAQPEPRPYPKSGRNEIQCAQFMVTA
ncbi:MAG TPA: molybdopterin-dependent oxidoreductase [Gemmataceae bacterium]|jgi:DMSO/TMAO reductase YedYZ molybdopterin-dependent catalytic subunit|nr:molybdopterin-dependent oxidoreductase [Gemmataceae bacterium]